MFTLYPMLSGLGMERHGAILRKAAALADEGKLKPLLNPERFSAADLDAAYAAVEAGSTGKVGCTHSSEVSGKPPTGD